MSDTMKITWLGHSCFKVESKGYAVIIDPYEDGYVDGLKPLRQEADLVLCSHEHGDHNARNLITLRQGAACPFKVETIDTYHDDQKGALRGKNTIHILDDGEFTIAHLGDLGCQLTAEQAEKLKDLDLVMIPVGGYYTIDALGAKQVVDQIKPRVTVPMHYRGEKTGFEVLSTLDAYTSLCDDVVHYDSSSLELSKDMPVQTAVLKIQQ